MTHKTVPRSPTEQMLRIGDHVLGYSELDGTEALKEAWQAMYDAAPAQPTLAAPLSTRASEILQAVVAGDERYHLDGKYVRWGIVEREINAVVADAYRQGAEAMREAAASFMDDEVSSMTGDRIRALPIPERK